MADIGICQSLFQQTRMKSLKNVLESNTDLCDETAERIRLVRVRVNVKSTWVIFFVISMQICTSNFLAPPIRHLLSTPLKQIIDVFNITCCFFTLGWWSLFLFISCFRLKSNISLRPNPLRWHCFCISEFYCSCQNIHLQIINCIYPHVWILWYWFDSIWQGSVGKRWRQTFLCTAQVWATFETVTLRDVCYYLSSCQQIICQINNVCVKQKQRRWLQILRSSRSCGEQNRLTDRHGGDYYCTTLLHRLLSLNSIEGN